MSKRSNEIPDTLPPSQSRPQDGPSQPSPAAGPPSAATGAAGQSGRFSFIDWYRGLACILMFETHAYDAWTRQPYRQGAWWELARMQLGGFPARMFLFLAGVSLMLRYASDTRKGVPDWTSRRQAMKRGAEVLLYGLAFRVFNWLEAGATAEAATNLFKVDILNCIGVSLILCSVLIGPRQLVRWRPPLLATLAVAALVLTTPLLQGTPYPTWLPRQLVAYLWDANPMGSFPLFPWLAYALSGCIIGGYYLQAAARGRLGTAMIVSAIVGAVMAVGGQVVTALGLYIYYPTAAVPVPAYPVSYVYRTGVVLLTIPLAYLWCLKFPRPRFSPLRLLGQASMLVYIVHIELVYGRPSWRMLHKLRPLPATVLVLVLTGLMVALAYWRIEVYGRRKKPTVKAAAPAPLFTPGPATGTEG